MLPEAEDEKREEPKTVDLQQSDSAKLEKEAMNSIQHQSEELEKYLEPSNEPRFSLMKFLRRERRSGAEEESSPSTSTSSDGGDNNGLPSYSEATSEAADTETAAVTVVDGATQTVEEEDEERNEDAPDNEAETSRDADPNESELTENPSTDINTNSRPSFRIFSFLKK